MKIVSLTGGGVFCRAQALTLFRAQRGMDLASVDLWAGTSGGGAVALAMAAGIQPSLVDNFFANWAPQIFAGRRWRNVLRAAIAPKYPDASLNIALQRLFDGRTVRQLKKPAVVTTHHLVWGVPEVIWTPNYGDQSEELWKLARMTMSAHTYFDSFMGRADGGIFHNDPCLAALIEAQRHRVAKLADIRLFSLGSGANVVDRRKENLSPWRKTVWLARILNDTLDGASVGAQREGARVLLDANGGRYDDYDFPHSNMDFDDPAVADMVAQEWAGHMNRAASRMEVFFT